MRTDASASARPVRAWQRLVAPLRALHLHVGLFISPFVAAFALSVVFLVHAWIPGARPEPRTRTVADVAVPAGLEQGAGREQIAAARELLDRLGVQGEIGYVRLVPAGRRVVIPVNVPGAETTVDLSLATRTATIASRDTGIWDALIYLHKMPGPHNTAIRGNSAGIHLWRFLADATVHAVLFLTLSGAYLWAALRAERRTGMIFLATGVATFCTLVYALVA